MEAFWVLLGQIFSVAVIQSILDMMIEKDKRPYLSTVLSVACYVICLYLLVQFIFTNLIPDIYGMFNQARGIIR